MIYKCRKIIPVTTDWLEVEADCHEEAAAEFHYKTASPGGTFGYSDEALFVEVEEPGNRYAVQFIKVEVEGYGNLISRVYHHRIYRKGGVRRWNYTYQDRLKEIAEKLDWSHDPLDLIKPGWEFETPPFEFES